MTDSDELHQGPRPTDQDTGQLFLVGKLLIWKTGRTLWFTFDGDEFDHVQDFFYDSPLAKCETAEDWYNIGAITQQWGDYSNNGYYFNHVFALERADESDNFIFIVLKNSTRFSDHGDSSDTKLLTQEITRDRADRLLAFLTNRLYRQLDNAG